MQQQTRLTNMAQAFLKAAERLIIAAHVPPEKVTHSPQIHWVARRIAVMQGKTGFIQNK